MIETILNGLLPVAFVILLGWLSCRIGLLKHEDAGVLATLVIRFALPLALFEGTVKTDRGGSRMEFHFSPSSISSCDALGSRRLAIECSPGDPR